jgi:PIN domain nuclease of toxin-antitoxin system
MSPNVASLSRRLRRRSRDHSRKCRGSLRNLWLDAALAEPGPIVEPLSARVAIESCELPGAFHGDPADRMIVATARVTNATLMSRDRRILDYAAGGHVTVVAA